MKLSFLLGVSLFQKMLQNLPVSVAVDAEDPSSTDMIVPTIYIIHTEKCERHCHQNDHLMKVRQCLTFRSVSFRENLTLTFFCV